MISVQKTKTHSRAVPETGVGMDRTTSSKAGVDSTIGIWIETRSRLQPRLAAGPNLRMRSGEPTTEAGVTGPVS